MRSPSRDGQLQHPAGAPDQFETYTVYVRFKGKRLTLLSRLRSVDAALDAAARLRRERFHDREDVVVVCDQTHRVIERPPAPRDAPASAPSPLVGLVRGTGHVETLRRALESSEWARARWTAVLEARLARMRAGQFGSRAECANIERLLTASQPELDEVAASVRRTISLLDGSSRPSG